ncbi:biotin synthetase [Escherichia coli]|uniref:Biotin synthetase n=1 Tax=Escherichia coli TaxID=562 RepID=A0A376P2S8_ECOLX|nr:biotin synthetase [Escherichia coli]
MAHRPRWTLSQVTELFEKPLLDLLFEAQQVHRQHFDPRQVQVSTLLSIKTGACPEDCKYCPQSSRYKTGLEAERLMEVEQVLESARQSESGRIDALLYGRGVEESPRTRYAVPGTNGAGGKSDGAGGVYDAGHVE